MDSASLQRSHLSLQAPPPLQLLIQAVQPPACVGCRLEQTNLTLHTRTYSLCHAFPSDASPQSPGHPSTKRKRLYASDPRLLPAYLLPAAPAALLGLPLTGESEAATPVCGLQGMFFVQDPSILPGHPGARHSNWQTPLTPASLPAAVLGATWVLARLSQRRAAGTVACSAARGTLECNRGVGAKRRVGPKQVWAGKELSASWLLHK